MNTGELLGIDGNSLLHFSLRTSGSIQIVLSRQLSARNIPNRLLLTAVLCASESKRSLTTNGVFKLEAHPSA